MSSGTAERPAATRGAPASCSVRFKHPNDLERFSFDWKELERGEVRGRELNPPAPGPSQPSLPVRVLDSDALGTTRGRCATCGLQPEECPGHFAQTPLAAPVFHPLLMSYVLRFLKASCPQCHRLRAGPTVVQAYAKQQALLRRGLAVEAAPLAPLLGLLVSGVGQKAGPAAPEGGAPAKKKAKRPPKAGDPSEDLGVPDFNPQAEIDALHAAALRRTPAGPPDALNAVDTRLWQEGDAQLWRLLGEAKACRHCGAGRPTLTRRGLKLWLKEADGRRRQWTPREVMEHLQQLWGKEADFIHSLYGHLGHSSERQEDIAEGWRTFFLTRLPIAPPRFRKTSMLAGRLQLHAHTKCLQIIYHLNMQYGALLARGTNAEATELANLANTLQLFVAGIYDSSLLPPRLQDNEGLQGVRQILEKKEGLFRNKLMSSRVNNAARSVISPDPSLETNELLVPVRYARKLTYPERAAAFNMQRLVAMVERGAYDYPGAVRVVFGSDHTEGDTVELGSLSAERRAEVAVRMMAAAPDQPVVVHRHVLTGDWVLFNRQPSLHRGSMLGKRARVVSHSRTFRFHYANCKGYNADFDGDEMNVHVPQSVLAQAEAQHLANADRHYIMPTAGKPVRGLIQDSVSMGVMMTKRDSFFDHHEYCQYVYRAVHPYLDQLPLESSGLLAPAVLRPRPLWTGKQIISTVLLYLCRLALPGGSPLNFEGANLVQDDLWAPAIPTPAAPPAPALPPAKKTKRPPSPAPAPTPPDPEMKDDRVVVRSGHLLMGVMDAKQLGAQAFSVVHALHELLGHRAAARALASLSRLFGLALHSFSFTCSIGDLCLKPEAEAQRAQLLADGDRSTLGLEAERLAIGAVNKASTTVNQLFPAGMQRSFPSNHLSMMTLAGSKGSKTNASQMAIHLGQQTIGEGARTRLMVTGRPYPTFTTDDLRAATHGWVPGRFLTGINPTNYFSHSIAGRDGLIDTAIKTASSGYLQRCLIKGLEGVTVRYDNTVRDSDRRVIQFRFGEDGLDPTKCAFILNRLKFYGENYKLLRTVYGPLDTGAEVLPVSPSFEAKLTEYLDGVNLVRLRNPVVAAKHADRDREMNATRRQWLTRCARLLYTKALVEPGEPVGLIAAQSVGEPSTQMTLNTFHHAGTSAEHVTEGIPRLKELLMIGRTKRPVHRFPIVAPEFHDRVQGLVRRKMLACTLADIVEHTRGMAVQHVWGASRVWHVQFDFDPAVLDRYGVALEELTAALRALEDSVLRKAARQVKTASATSGPTSVAPGTGALELAPTDAAAPAADLPTAGKGRGKGKETATEEDSAADTMAQLLEAQSGRKKVAAGPEDAGEEREEEEEEEEGEGKPEGDGEASDEDSDTDQEEFAGSSAGSPSDVEDEAPEAEVASDGEDSSQDEEAESSPRPVVAKPKAKAKAKPQAKAAAAAAAAQGRGGRTGTKRKAAALKDGAAEDGLTPSAKNGPFQVRSGWVSHPEPRYAMAIECGGADFCDLRAILKEDLRRIKVHDRSILSASIDEDPNRKGRSVLTLCGGKLRQVMAMLSEEMACFEFLGLYSSDVLGIVDLFGVEAGCQALKAELRAVFGSKSIEVDLRHHILLAEYCFAHGSYRVCSRGQLVADSPGMFHKMSFETSTHFLIQAAMMGAKEPLTNPSARLMVALTPELGSGAQFEVRT